jgi:hypothetical protein
MIKNQAFQQFNLEILSSTPLALPLHFFFLSFKGGEVSLALSPE